MAEPGNVTQRHMHWIGGWGVAPDSVQALAARAFPAAAHTCVPPTRSALDNLPPCDQVVGWSLGAWLLLDAASRGVALPSQVRLLAPFPAFAADYNLGGRCSLTQVRYLQRWLKRDPLNALKDFYTRAGLGTPREALPYPLADLHEGLERLTEDASPALRRFLDAGAPAGWKSFVGSRDPLLDAERIAITVPSTIIIPEVGHDAASLLAAVQTSHDAV